MTTSSAQSEQMTERNPWPALWALVIGFFMILVDSTIVAVANPAIMSDLQTDINSVVWVTSAYLLAYAVPLLVTGRLGDRFGPKNVYLIGLVLFTGASLWCGLSGTVTMLIVARVFQGFGAALMTPHTMAVITRTFPPDRRGTAMGLWGAVAGVATLVGPLAGGLLVDSLGWEWIFIVNVPVGVIAFVMAWRLVPALPTNSHKFDIPGVILSAAGMFFLVFGIQEGSTYDWSGLVLASIAAGLVILGVFVWYQSWNRNEPLVPLSLFSDRNFSLANLAIMSMGFAITAMVLPLMFYTQAVRGMSPTTSALLLIPMAVLTGVFAPFVGRLVDRTHPRYIAGTGFLLFAIALGWLATVMTPQAQVWELLLPIGLIGFANACIWSPLAATATHNLEPQKAGAGAGVYNTTRQAGAVLGSAAMGALITARLAAGGVDGGGEESTIRQLPEFVREPFSTAMSESMWLPAAVLVVGFVCAVCFARPVRATHPARTDPNQAADPNQEADPDQEADTNQERALQD
ncbi:MAG: MFS transporter [Rhodococcus sp.]|nr:MFS transporter [Rhodococcus sp. (in: high G+C Gram-positive bacteria)]